MTLPITIVGGGLCGLALSIGLRRNGVPVVLYEAASYPRHRVCGEFISGLSARCLETLCLADALAPALRHHSYQWRQGENVLCSGRLPQPAYGISRHALDLFLFKQALKAGVAIYLQQRHSNRDVGPGTVWAAGRRADTNSPWIGLKAHVAGLSLTADLEMHIGPGGYLGITPVEGGWLNLCGLFRKNGHLSGKREDLLISYLQSNGNSQLAQQLQGASWRQGSWCAVAGLRLGPQRHALPPGESLALGDAHAMIPPFTGNGMTMAFESACVALPHLLAYSKRELSWGECKAQIRRALAKRFSLRLRSAAILHPLLFSKQCIAPVLRIIPQRPLLALLR